MRALCQRADAWLSLIKRALDAAATHTFDQQLDLELEPCSARRARAPDYAEGVRASGKAEAEVHGQEY